MPDTWANKSRNGLYSNCYLRRLENDLKIIRKKKKKKKTPGKLFELHEGKWGGN